MRLIQVYSIKTNLLKVDDAFAFSATLSTDKSQLQAHWDIADGYYLYQDKISAELVGKSNPLFTYPTSGGITSRSLFWRSKSFYSLN